MAVIFLFSEEYNFVTFIKYAWILFHFMFNVLPQHLIFFFIRFHIVLWYMIIIIICIFPFEFSSVYELWLFFFYFILLFPFIFLSLKLHHKDFMRSRNWRHLKKEKSWKNCISYNLWCRSFWIVLPLFQHFANAIFQFKILHFNGIECYKWFQMKNYEKKQ